MKLYTRGIVLITLACTPLRAMDCTPAEYTHKKNIACANQVLLSFSKTSKTVHDINNALCHVFHIADRAAQNDFEQKEVIQALAELISQRDLEPCTVIKGDKLEEYDERAQAFAEEILFKANKIVCCHYRNPETQTIRHKRKLWAQEKETNVTQQSHIKVIMVPALCIKTAVFIALSGALAGLSYYDSSLTLNPDFYLD